ncbi:MAG: sporulation protein YunB [Oscillospiraceae bacterium]|jgi:sporulation protein YunB|nr:sporulation protein YunB [Oscillospiraceae bacterium]
MTNAEKTKKKRLGRRFIITGLLLLAFAFYVDFQVRPLIERVAEFQCRNAAVRLINDAVLAELNSEIYNYDSIINLAFDLNGEVKSITSNMNTINRLKSRSALLINDAVDGLPKMDIGISLGTVSGVGVLYGRGPVIPVRVLPKGYANAVLISEFTSAGINQTLHRIIMEVEVEITAVIPGFSRSMMVRTNYIVAETVIVGEVPNMYMQVISGDGQLFSRIGEAIA